MNSGVPGSPRNGGPPFQAYQYVLRAPSASFLVTELRPLSLIRMFGHPSIERAGFLRLRFVGLNLNHALWINPDRTDRTHWYPGFDHALDGPGHIRLPECGRRASHITATPRVDPVRVQAAQSPSRHCCG